LLLKEFQVSNFKFQVKNATHIELVIKGVSSFKFKVPSKERYALGTWNLELET
jgi:hypothetical protein